MRYPRPPRAGADLALRFWLAHLGEPAADLAADSRGEVAGATGVAVHADWPLRRISRSMLASLLRFQIKTSSSSGTMIESGMVAMPGHHNR